MRKYLLLLTFTVITLQLEAEVNWPANWITDQDGQNEPNSWFCFRKEFTLGEIPKTAIAKIAVDSKYWLWINGSLVVFEGGLKRGPSPQDTYYDELDISTYLINGENNISALGWCFGKDGFGGGTTNHAWSGGALTILSQYLCGIEPLKPDYELFQVIPNPGSLDKASAIVESVKGTIKSGFERTKNKYQLDVSIPANTEAIIGIPEKDISNIKLNDKNIWRNGALVNNDMIKSVAKSDDNRLIEESRFAKKAAMDPPVTYSGEYLTGYTQYG